jgi:hypothetical protein
MNNLAMQLRKTNPGIDPETMFSALDQYQHLMDGPSKDAWERFKFETQEQRHGYEFDVGERDKTLDRGERERQFGIEEERLRHQDARSDREFKLQTDKFAWQQQHGDDTVAGAGWEVLNDPTNQNKPYRFNKRTGEARDFENKPYTPGGASKVGAASNAPLKPEQAKYLAQIYQLSGMLPPGIARSSAAVQQIMNSMDVQGTPGEFLANMGSKQADFSSLKNMQKMRDAAVSFEQTASKNFDQAAKYADAAIPTDWGPWLNRWIESGKTQFGDVPTPAYVTALLTAANEYAKVMQGSTGAQGATVDARREAAELFSPYLSKGQISEVIKVAKQEMDNRTNMLDGTIGEIEGRLRTRGGQEGGRPQQGSPSPSDGGAEEIPLPDPSIPESGVVYDAQGARWQRNGDKLRKLP